MQRDRRIVALSVFAGGWLACAGALAQPVPAASPPAPAASGSSGALLELPGISAPTLAPDTSRPALPQTGAAPAPAAPLPLPVAPSATPATPPAIATPAATPAPLPAIAPVAAPKPAPAAVPSATKPAVVVPAKPAALPVAVAPVTAPIVAAPPAAPTPALTPPALKPLVSEAPAPAPEPAQPQAAPNPAAAGSPSPTILAVDPAVVISKNPDITLMPLQLKNTSLMFSPTELNLMRPFVEAYDSVFNPAKKEDTEENKDLQNLMESLHSQENAPQAAPMPNIYLGSILYYSPSHWSVWLNGKKLVSKNNAVANEFYVRQISRTEIELIWRPSSLTDTYAQWQSRTNGGIHPIDNISMDSARGTITLRMRPNQTFIAHEAAICEGVRRTCGLVAAPPAPSESMSPDFPPLPASMSPSPVPPGRAGLPQGLR